MISSDLEFVQTNKGSEQVWQKRRRWGGEMRTVLFKDYDVFAQVDGERVKLGRVYQSLATFERKTRGRTYVNSRWSSPRWFYEVDRPVTRQYMFHRETKKSAAESLAESWTRDRTYCPTCRGEGTIKREPCTACEGSGMKEEFRDARLFG